jgi:hypothetical protein
MRTIVSLNLLAVALFCGASLTCAQEAANPPKPGTPQKQSVKSHKVWTDDDLGTIRSRGNVTVAAAQTLAIPTAADASQAPAPAASEKPSAAPARPTGKAALSNPKTPAEADGMIAWEQRDIDSQQEFVDRLQTQLEQAPPDQREHLQKSLAEHQQSLADTRQEQAALIAQKKLLQKKAAGETSAASSQSPQ